MGIRSARLARVCSLLLALTPALLHAAAASPEEVERLAARFPAVEVAENSTPFIARGSMPSNGYAYEIVWDGKAYRATVFDSEDGLPITVSTQRELVHLDLVAGKMLRKMDGHVIVRVQSSGEGATTGTTMMLGVTNDDVPLPQLVWFDLRDAIRAANDESTIETLADGSVRLTQQVTRDVVRIVVFEPPPSRNVSWGQISKSSGRYTSYHELKLSGIDFADPALRAVSLDGLGIERMKTAPLDVMLANFERLGRTVQFTPFARRAERGDPEAQATLTAAGMRWQGATANADALREPWLAALRKTGVTLRMITTPDHAPIEPLVTRTEPTTAPGGSGSEPPATP